MGYVISKEGIQMDKDKVDIIAILPFPTSIREFRFLLGYAGYY